MLSGRGFAPPSFSAPKPQKEGGKARLLLWLRVGTGGCETRRWTEAFRSEKEFEVHCAYCKTSGLSPTTACAEPPLRMPFPSLSLAQFCFPSELSLTPHPLARAHGHSRFGQSEPPHVCHGRHHHHHHHHHHRRRCTASGRMVIDVYLSSSCTSHVQTRTARAA